MLPHGSLPDHPHFVLSFVHLTLPCVSKRANNESIPVAFVFCCNQCNQTVVPADWVLCV